jgi:hypothetical protein
MIIWHATISVLHAHCSTIRAFPADFAPIDADLPNGKLRLLSPGEISTDNCNEHEDKHIINTINTISIIGIRNITNINNDRREIR